MTDCLGKKLLDEYITPAYDFLAAVVDGEAENVPEAFGVDRGDKLVDMLDNAEPLLKADADRAIAIDGTEYLSKMWDNLRDVDFGVKLVQDLYADIHSFDFFQRRSMPIGAVEEYNFIDEEER